MPASTISLPASLAGWRLLTCKPISTQPLFNRNLWQPDILHHGPDNGQTTGFRGEGSNLIRSLPHIAKETFDGIGVADVAMHDRWKRIKGQQMFFIFAQAANRFWRAFLIFGFEGRQIEQHILFLLLFPASLPVGRLPLASHGGEER